MPNGARARPNLRPDHNGPQRAQFESNKKRIYATQTVCGICGREVNCCAICNSCYAAPFALL